MQYLDISPDNPQSLSVKDLVETFNQLFFVSLNTRLIGGAEEPIYRPQCSSSDHNSIVFTRDYGASALHEVAHWCVAGETRRKLEDYGYWYWPDGRSEHQQLEFERVEVKPQAMEWIFSVAAGRQFRVSADNLQGGMGPTKNFKNNIHAQVMSYCRNGLPERAALFAKTLAVRSGCDDPMNPMRYEPNAL